MTFVVQFVSTPQGSTPLEILPESVSRTTNGIWKQAVSPVAFEVVSIPFVSLCFLVVCVANTRVSVSLALVHLDYSVQLILHLALCCCLVGASHTASQVLGWHFDLTWSILSLLWPLFSGVSKRVALTVLGSSLLCSFHPFWAVIDIVKSDVFIPTTFFASLFKYPDVPSS